jgi:hypothetical protein
MKTCSPDRTDANRGGLPLPFPHFSCSARGTTGGRHVAIVALITLALTVSGCAYYSFTGATIPSNLETIAIPLAQDNTVSPISTLGRDLTDQLTERFVERTRLSLTTNESNADALLNARIQRYTNEPSGVSADERATVNRVTIQVRVEYVDQTNDEALLDRTFSGFGEYDPVEDGVEGERQAAQVALQRVADDIFTSATSNW